jgi:Cupin-like domain
VSVTPSSEAKIPSAGMSHRNAIFSGGQRSSRGGRLFRSSDFLIALTIFTTVFIICTVYLINRLDFQNTDNTIAHSVEPQQRSYEPWAPFADTHTSRPYELVDCPPTPAPDYPKAYNMYGEVLQNWNADSTEIPPVHYDSLCHFDFQNETQRAIALTYRDAERPFVGYNIPEVEAVVKKWGNLDYLRSKLGDIEYYTTTSESSHFMYFSGKDSEHRLRNGQLWKPTTKTTYTTFEDWLKVAVKGQNETTENRHHEYFRVSSDMGNMWLFDELPFFRPKPSAFVADPTKQDGIHCRFGMRGVTAEAHFDAGRNAVVMLGGLRRWILTHPSQCQFMHMYPREHPSGRHSEVDWQKPDLNLFPNFDKVMGNEVILGPGDYLWVPMYWIHYIISLNVNYQCNTRSGTTHDYDDDVRRCGF